VELGNTATALYCEQFATRGRVHRDFVEQANDAHQRRQVDRSALKPQCDGADAPDPPEFSRPELAAFNHVIVVAHIEFRPYGRERRWLYRVVGHTREGKIELGDVSVGDAMGGD
jgi:hypothetical protein